MVEKRQTSLFSGVCREIRKKIHQFRRKCKKNRKLIQLFNRDFFWRFLTKKLRLENVAFSLNLSIYVVGSPLARPLGRLGPLPHSLVGLVLSNQETTSNLVQNVVEGLCISGNPNKGNSVIRCIQQTRPNGNLVVSSYSTYIRRLVTQPFFRSRARVALGSELRLLMSFSWPVFPGLDQDLFPPWFSSFFGIRFQNGAKECIV